MAYTAPEIDLAAPAGILPAGSSWLDVADANTYFANTFNASAWNAISTAEQTVALAEATKWLETLCWAGEKCDPAQPMAWPRKIAATDCCASAVCTTLPPAIVQAVAELALALHSNQTALVSSTAAASPTGPVKRQKLDVLEVEYFEAGAGASSTSSSNGRGPLVLRTFPWLKDMLRCYYAGTSNRQIRLYRN
jgi:hypothetical protein